MDDWNETDVLWWAKERMQELLEECDDDELQEEHEAMTCEEEWTEFDLYAEGWGDEGDDDEKSN
jgi:hypothetical protein